MKHQYLVTLSASFVVLADNAMLAKRAAQKLRVIPGNCAGGFRVGKHDVSSYSIDPCGHVTVKVERHQK